MKKMHLMVFLLALLLSGGVFAGNDQKVYDLSSPVYEQMEELSIAAGFALPSSTKPWNMAEVEMMLQRFDRANLDAGAANLYDAIASTIDKELAPFIINTVVNPEMYVHTNSSSFVKSDDWFKNYEKRSFGAAPQLHFNLGDSFYGFMQLVELRNNKQEGDGSSSWFSDNFSTNFSGLYTSSTSLTVDFPLRAFLAFGGKGWAAEIGREQLDWGSSEIGNLIIDNHLAYQNMFRLTAYGNWIKYTFLTSFFTSPDEVKNKSYSLESIKMFMGHRFEWRAGNRVNLTLTEGIMYQPKNNVLDLRVLNPMGLFHNYYISDDANSIASLEMDFAPAKHWNIYGTWAVDEMRFLWTEKADDPKVHPDAMGYMLGTKCAYPVRQGTFKGSLEFVYTTPYLYMRSGTGDDTQTDEYDTLNFVVASRRWINGTLVYDQNYLGFPYGGDSIVGQLKGSYASFAGWEAGLRLFYMIHGMMRKNSNWTVGPDAYQTKTPSGGWDKASRTAILGFTGAKDFGTMWHLDGEMDIIHIANKNNEVGNDQWDVQWSFGVRFQISSPKHW